MFEKDMKEREKIEWGNKIDGNVLSLWDER